MSQATDFKYPNPADPNQPFAQGPDVLNKGFKNIWKGILWLFSWIIK